jgi:hypothetical protein
MSDGPSAYGYVGGNPLAYVDAEGTGPIGRTIGGWVGSIIAGALGLESGPGDVFIVQSGRFIGGEIGSAIEDLTAQADERYPKKKGKCENHHIVPEYLGGPKNGPTIRIPAPYHQLITNQFEQTWSWRSGMPNDQQLVTVLRKVYDKYPISPNYQCCDD